MPIISDYIKLYNIINKKSIVAYLNLSGMGISESVTCKN